MSSRCCVLAGTALIALAACREPSRGRGEIAAVGSGSATGSAPAPSEAPPSEAPPSDASAERAIPPPPDLAAPPASATRTASGVASTVLKRGTGKDRPQLGDLITVEYTAWSSSGEVFDSSVQRGAPETLPFASAPRAWREAVAEMTVGERRRIWIPEGVAAQGRSTGSAGALVYEVALLKIASPPAVPKDLDTPGPDATRTASGLAYKRLVKGSGTVHPTGSNMLAVHYTGWAADGTIVDSTVLYGRPAERPLSGFSLPLAEALQAMVVGDKLRVWVPPPATSGDAGAGPPAIAYDVELITLR
jgi:FKBP-type peptidyl-prolyl cis-trans isomerase